jgi:pyruvate formate lyase activating enzyme
VVIERDWDQLGAYGLDESGRCTACGTAMAGVFDGPAGGWGPRRRPVTIDRRPQATEPGQDRP